MLMNGTEYFSILENIKIQKISTQNKAIMSKIILYWEIEKKVLSEKVSGGNKLIDHLFTRYKT